MMRSRLLLHTATVSLLLLAGSSVAFAQKERTGNQKSLINDPTNNVRIPETMGDVTLSDLLGKERSINMFASFTRDIDSVTARFESASQNATVLAPTNANIRDLPRKPWEDARDYEKLGAEAYAGSEGQSRAQENLEAFVKAHVVPQSPWREGEKVKSLAGEELWWRQKMARRG